MLLLDFHGCKIDHVEHDFEFCMVPAVASEAPALLPRAEAFQAALLAEFSGAGLRATHHGLPGARFSGAWK